MKKTLLAVSVLSTLFMAGAVNAAMVEGSNGSFSGQLDFNGTITDTTPIWMWEIPEASKNAATGWTVDVREGVVADSNTTWTFPDKSALDLIQGFMKFPIAEGGAGITPLIKVGPTDSATILDGTLQTITLVANGKDTSDVDVAAGAMELKVQGFLGGVYGSGQKFGAAETQTVVAKQVNFSTNYPTLIDGTGSFSEAETEFTKEANKTLSGAYLVKISDYSLTFPTASIPATWNTIVPVTVTMK
ncbi:fimbrial protein [Photobacterium kishitanii]|uniref:F4 family fimbrial subunit n=1 Tax=Photobacterium kishitanii TaxID=318456 RepID=UPI000D177D52|nr:fimbrial protein [Photobacterium kishitanii]PSU87405.1 fimbrial protein [Photobacterium kishitanii]